MRRIAQGKYRSQRCRRLGPRFIGRNYAYGIMLIILAQIIALLLPASVLAAPVATIALRGVTTGSTTSTSRDHVTIVVPAAVQANDVMLAQIAVRGGSGSIVTPPAQWTLVRRDNNTNTIAQAIYFHVVTSTLSEPARYIWWLTSGMDAVGGIAAYGGVNAATPVDVAVGQANRTSTTITAPSVTVLAGHNTNALMGAFAIPNSSRITGPTGMTQRWSLHATSGGIGVEMSDLALTTSGATGSKLAIAAIAGANVGALVALRPANLVASPTGTPTQTPKPVATSTPTATATRTPTPSPRITPGPGGQGYYVDPSGSDASAGTSPTQAWRSIAKVNSWPFQPGDVIYFKAGGLWRETLNPGTGGAAGAPITFTAYGAGSQPVISGSDLVTGWSLYSGSVYHAPLPTQAGNVFVDGGPGWGLANATGLSAMTAGSWFWDGSSTLYVRLADGSNPANHTVEAATRIYGYQTDTWNCDRRSYLVVNGLRFQRTAGHGIFFHCSNGPAAMMGIVIQNNTVTQTGTGQVDGGQYYNGIMLLQEPPYANTSPQILNNTVSYSGGHGNALNIQGANNALIVGNDVSIWNHNGIDIKNATGVVVSGNVGHDQGGPGNAFYAEHSDVTWTRNIVRNVKNGFQVSVQTNGVLYNNSLYNVGTGFYFGPSGYSMTLKNNASNAAIVAVGSDGGANLTDDYNDWGLATHFQIQIDGNWATFSQYLASGDHAHDIATDPMWLNPTAGNFQLSAASLCINAGTYVGLPYSGSAPDMGAVESPY